MFNTYQLLGQWMTELLQQFFNEQREQNAEKLFIKIVGLDDQASLSLLSYLTENERELSHQYKPVIRTIRPVLEFPQYTCQAYETSTWLRNNTQYNQALILILNENSPEAQSLENIFTIDESRLMSSTGLESLYKVLAEKHDIYPQDLKTVKEFLDLYRKIAEPQLQHLLSFMIQLIKDTHFISIIDRIQMNLSELNLFVDKKLQIQKSSLSRLKKNYYLARLLQADGRAFDKEILANNLYNFIHTEEQHQLQHEVWQKVSPEEFRAEALRFIDELDPAFLQYDFDFVSSVFNYKMSKVKFHDEVANFLDSIKDELNDSQIKAANNAIEAIRGDENPEAVQEFIEDCGEKITGNPALTKKLVRYIEKKRQSHEYNDLTIALMYECFYMLEEIQEQLDVSSAQFELSIVNSSVSEQIQSFLKFHLINLQNHIPSIQFIKRSLPSVNDKAKDSDVHFELTLSVGEEVLKRKFTVQIISSYLPEFLSKIDESGYLSYRKNFLGEIISLDPLLEAEERVKEYISTDEYPGVTECMNVFRMFFGDYTDDIKRASSEGIGSISSSDLELSIEHVLSYVRHNVLVSRYIFQYIGIIGAIDNFSCKKGDIGLVNNRVLTLINPIRLLSFIKRLESVQQQINLWISRLQQGDIRIQEINEYIQYSFDNISNLFPQYFAVDGLGDKFLIQDSECMGESSYILSGKSGGSEQLVETFADELLQTVKNYLEVYPYAKDCLDLVYLFCPHAEYVIKGIDRVFKETEIINIRLLVHSDQHGADFHQLLNGWLTQKEEYLFQGNSKFPRVEIQVLAEQDINRIKDSVTHSMRDVDIAVLVNYFGQSNQIQYKLEKVDVTTTDNWFGVVYKEPLKKDEAVKRISIVSEYLPKSQQYFYQLQYMVNTHMMVEENENFLLRSIISINNNSDIHLINFMHEKFNWSLFIDRYLDKSLLRQASSKAQIIRYKSKAGKNKNYRTILSSSNYIRKLANETVDHAYYDRLYQKFVSLLKNNQIDRSVIIQAVEKVKEISGGAVLRAIGPGKFAHELMAIYLATQSRLLNEDSLHIWSVCDELPWFQRNQRRPDLVRTSISKEEHGLFVEFELVELKFITHHSFETERYDAVNQIKAGIDLYQKLFNFQEPNANSEMWRKELVHYLIELGTYSAEHTRWLRELQSESLENIHVTMSCSIDTFIYTSNMYDCHAFEGHEQGKNIDNIANDYPNAIYNRAYILKALGVQQETEIPSYEELKHPDKLTMLNETLNELEQLEGQEESEQQVQAPNINELIHQAEKQYQPEEESAKKLVASTIKEESTSPVYIPVQGYPEKLALVDVELSDDEDQEDITDLADTYIKKLRYKLNENGIQVRVKQKIVGSSVIRLILDELSVPVQKLKSRAEDIQLWLQLDSPPHIFIYKDVIIDINREKPQTIYFEKFMYMVREQLDANQIKNRLIAPLGVGQLNDVIFMDFSSSDTPHLLIGGRTGSGKSVTINSIILGIMCLYRPEEVQFMFIDPKRVEFITYENREHTLAVITHLDEAVAALEQLVEEMETRYKKFAEESVTSIDQFIEVTKQQLPRIVVVFDEFADFMVQERSLASRVENAILRLGAKARAAGIHLLICTQNPKADVVPTNIRNNLGARLALRATDHHASKIILDEEGAERLGGKGDFLAKLDTPNIQRGKSPFLTAPVKRALLQYFNRQL